MSHITPAASLASGMIAAGSRLHTAKEAATVLEDVLAVLYTLRPGEEGCGIMPDRL